jgi:GNAT superfamily N-acetyltransferase
VDIRPLRPDDSFEDELDLARRSFGPVADADRARRLADSQAAAAEGRYYAAFDGPSMLAVAGFHDLRQWWHGRPVRMAGVGGVRVAPEARGRGIGTALMTELLRVIAERGYPLSVLFPATAPVYRSLGWELAGGYYEATVPTRSLAALPPADIPAGPLPALRRAGPDDADQVVAVVGSVHEAARHCGPATWTAAAARRWWLDDETVFCYLAPDGFLAYGWHHSHREIFVQRAVAGSAETTRAIWSLLGSHASMAERVKAVVAPDEPVGWLTREPDLEVEREPWMLRIVDAAASIAGRGFPALAELAVALQIDDATRPGNAGLWTLEVSGGQGSLHSSVTLPPALVPPAGPVRLGARGFAALYAGIPMATLRRSGLAAGGDPGADDALDSAFAGPAFLLDDF